MDQPVRRRSLSAAWFAQRGWKPFAFQKEVWQAVKASESGLLHASTGSGKTYAVWFAALDRFATPSPAVTASPRPRKKPVMAPLTVLWITPMRALAADTARALQAPLDDLQIPWDIGLRTGDTSSAERARQSRKLPSTLITTPESLTLMVADLEQAAGPGGYQDPAFAIDDERPAPRKGRSPRQGKDGLPRPPAQRPKKRR